MHMSFWWGKKIENFLIYGLSVNSVGGVLALCLGCALLAFLFEWIKLIQAKEKQKELIIRAKQIKTICPPKEDASLLPDNATMHKPLDLSMRNRISIYACDTSLWLVLHNLGYLIMLTIMAFNLWIFLSVLVGGGLGYFVFGQMFMKLNLENCQVIRDTYCMSTCSKPGRTFLH